MKIQTFKLVRSCLLAGIFAVSAACFKVEAADYISNLGDIWTGGGIGDIHALFPGGTPYGSDTAYFATGAGNGFTINALTLEFDAVAPSQDWANIKIQLYQQTGNLLLGSFGNPGTSALPSLL